MQPPSPRLTRMQREAYEAVRRACAAPLDSIQLRQEVSARTSAAIPSEVSGMATSDPEFGLFAHGIVWNYPDALLREYYASIYPQEGAIQFIDLARSGQLVTTGSGPIETAALRPYGFGEKLHVAFGDQGRLWGAWCLIRDQGAVPFSDAELGLASAIAPMVAGALRRAALLEAAEAAPAVSDEIVPSAPGVAIYDAGGRLVLRDERAARYLADLDDVGQRAELPSPVSGALTALRWRLRAPDTHRDLRADAGVRVRGRSGRWYTVHASAAESIDAAHAGQAVVVLTPLAGAERASILAQLYGLTPREREVVVRIAHGESGKQIAAALGLSAHTVQAHIDNACAKMGVRGRKELVARLFVDTTAVRVAS